MEMLKQKYKESLRTMGVRAMLLFFLSLCPLYILGVGWTPTDAGFVLNFEPGDQFLLSVWIDLNNNKVEDAGEEFFVCDYPSYNGGRFNYKAENYMKLVPQAAGATKPSEASVWTIGEPIKRVVNKVNYDLGGICYTMWGNSGRTLYAAESPTKSSTFKFLGYLTDNESHGDLCDVAIVVPSNNERTVNMDPNNTLGRGGKFNGRMGTGFLGMTYREVYLFDIPRQNTPIAYTNASLVTFNTSNSTKSWSAGSIKPGFAAYAFADTKHNPTTRTVFRIYPLNKPFVSAEGTYFFGWDVQDYTRYRQTNTGPAYQFQSTSTCSSGLENVYEPLVREPFAAGPAKSGIRRSLGDPGDDDYGIGEIPNPVPVGSPLVLLVLAFGYLLSVVYRNRLKKNC